MPLHLVKLCVGCRDIAHLAAFQKGRLEATGRNAHVTRMVPRRAEEILDGGSLYWVINGMITVRQRIVAIEPFVDDEGVKRCRLELDPELVPVRPVPRRPFQGWRYLEDADAPPDMDRTEGDDELPEEMRRDLGNLGLL